MTDVTDEALLAAAVKAMCKEQAAQMGEPEPDGCNGLCEGCDHERALIKVSISAIAPMIRAAALEEAAMVVDTGAGWIGKFNRTPGALMSELIAAAIRARKEPRA